MCSSASGPPKLSKSRRARLIALFVHGMLISCIFELARNFNALPAGFTAVWLATKRNHNEQHSSHSDTVSSPNCELKGRGQSSNACRHGQSQKGTVAMEPIYSNRDKRTSSQWKDGHAMHRRMAGHPPWLRAKQTTTYYYIQSKSFLFTQGEALPQ